MYVCVYIFRNNSETPEAISIKLTYEEREVTEYRTLYTENHPTSFLTPAMVLNIVYSNFKFREQRTRNF